MLIFQGVAVPVDGTRNPIPNHPFPPFGGIMVAKKTLGKRMG